MILLVDNYDSFTWNLVQYFWRLEAEVEVVRNDQIDVHGIRRRRPHALVLSPGPCAPDQAGVCLDAVRALSGTLPILGVCLGHQAIGQAFGGRVVRAGRVMHGKTSPVSHDGSGTFHRLPERLVVGRYHSLVVEEASLPSELRVVARAEDDGEIMALAHREHPTFGIQFHPESVLTPEGITLMQNFLEVAGC
jgi:anthranilate synthase/aminodeoxychorismate synthase-like glutamine amidotransferase